MKKELDKGGTEKRPSGPPPPPTKPKQSVRPASYHGKFNLTPVQKVQVEIIDWKRCSVRSLLIIAYVTLIHLIAYLLILAYSYSLITISVWLMAAFFGFFVDLGLYFFGSGAALKAITYVWRPIRFSVGIVTIIVGMLLNVGLFFLGTRDTQLYNLTACENSSPINTTDIEDICDVRRPVELALLFIPLILPPTSLVCVICAIISAYKAVYVTPLKLPKWQVNAKWLEPYETYDFYVGRNIPRIPGYDEVFEEDHAEKEAIEKYFDDLDDEDTEIETEQETVTLSDAEAEKEEHKKGHQKTNIKKRHH